MTYCPTDNDMGQVPFAIRKKGAGDSGLLSLHYGGDVPV